MNPTAYALRIGLARGWIEFRATITRPQELFGNYLMVPVVLLGVLFFMRDTTVAGTTLPLASLSLPGVIGMMLVYGPMTAVAVLLSAEREDGTLLRAKAVPNGMVGYVTGMITRTALDTVTFLVILLIPGVLLFDGLFAGGPGGLLTLLWLGSLGLVASVPLGLIIGSVVRSPRAVGGWLFFLSGGLVAISGIFYPITALAGWLQGIAQVFPFYWVGLGIRSALLPDEAAAVEIGQSWRHLETVAVLGAWSVIGLLIAPVVLRRMARGESGSNVEERRQKALQRL
ncbi:MAG TPA: ABC transporter permease [Actinophytocola sp.]|uniref:ABC transporter permease n=1 Tax=Actinophytocola sp. TaxID=1872138 RepID=UPI002DDD6336|nr:ABC transporter permease [Actinophytocola sp.]HEV2779976.1 ABC transporter permease [Actinophytocola sp.]